jgi:hypothetical protein
MKYSVFVTLILSVFVFSGCFTVSHMPMGDNKYHVVVEKSVIVPMQAAQDLALYEAALIATEGGYTGFFVGTASTQTDEQAIVNTNVNYAGAMATRTVFEMIIQLSNDERALNAATIIPEYE